MSCQDPGIPGMRKAWWGLRKLVGDEGATRLLRIHRAAVKLPAVARARAPFHKLSLSALRTGHACRNGLRVPAFGPAGAAHKTAAAAPLDHHRLAADRFAAVQPRDHLVTNFVGGFGRLLDGVHAFFRAVDLAAELVVKAPHDLRPAGLSLL